MNSTEKLKKKIDENSIIKGFSKLNREDRMALVSKLVSKDVKNELDSFLHQNANLQDVFSEFSENYLANFFLPFGIVPNVLVDNELFTVPVVVEESSVVAAASRAARFWAERGGFKTHIFELEKKGQVHFLWDGEAQLLHDIFPELKSKLLQQTAHLTRSMEKRGGGIREIVLLDLSHKIENYFQLDVSFETADAMGANFINSCLEQMASTLEGVLNDFQTEGQVDVIMSILSNHTPNNTVQCTVECPIDDLKPMAGQLQPLEFAKRFELAVKMAQVDVSRAVTHNKGIYNGVDAVVLATGNDWRAIEAAGHAYAVRNGAYASLTRVKIENDIFTYTLELPLAVGTVGGLTKAHPLAQLALEILNSPSAQQLMRIIAAVGLANNFSAVSSLVTTGIQKGHMKMHLTNILNQLDASADQKILATDYFKDRTVSYSAVQQYLNDTNK